MPVDYALSKIYKICDDVTGDCYVGATTKRLLSQRLAEHVCECKRWQQGKRGKVMSFEIIARGTYHIELIEDYPCSTKDQLNTRERFWIQNTPCINKVKNVGIINEMGKQEYQKQRCAQYYQINSVKILLDKATKVACSCGSIVTKTNNARHESSTRHQRYEALQQQKTQITTDPVPPLIDPVTT